MGKRDKHFKKHDAEKIFGLINKVEQLPYLEREPLKEFIVETEQIIRALFGDSSEYLEDLKSIRFIPPSFFSTDVDYKENWKTGKKRTLKLLEKLIQDKKIGLNKEEQKWLDENIERINEFLERPDVELPTDQEPLLAEPSETFVSDSPKEKTEITEEGSQDAIDVMDEILEHPLSEDQITEIMEAVQEVEADIIREEETAEEALAANKEPDVPSDAFANEVHPGDFIPVPVPEPRPQAFPSPQSNRVLIVDGGNSPIREEIVQALSRVGLEPVFSHQLPLSELTVTQQQKECRDIHFVIVLLTLDACMYMKNDDPAKARFIPRPEIIFELGFWVSTVGRMNVFTLYVDDPAFQRPTKYFLDAYYVPYDLNGYWKNELIKSLQKAGTPLKPMHLVVA